jgi:hypothetical protein
MGIGIGIGIALSLKKLVPHRHHFRRSWGCCSTMVLGIDNGTYVLPFVNGTTSKRQSADGISRGRNQH